MKKRRTFQAATTENLHKSTSQVYTFKAGTAHDVAHHRCQSDGSTRRRTTNRTGPREPKKKTRVGAAVQLVSRGGIRAPHSGATGTWTRTGGRRLRVTAHISWHARDDDHHDHLQVTLTTTIRSKADGGGGATNATSGGGRLRPTGTDSGFRVTGNWSELAGGE